MTTKNTIRRDYLIIRRLLKNDCPSKHDLKEYLKINGAEVGERTFQRDISDIRSNFDIRIIYDEKRNGYYINHDSIFELDKLLYFIGLAESYDAVLSCLKDKKRLSKYLSIALTPHSKGVEKIGVLLKAMHDLQIINFSYLSYRTGLFMDYTVNPYLLKEFDGMWYLLAFVEELKSFRTFGLERITNLIVTDSIFQRDEILDETAERFNNVYGLIYESTDSNNPPIERVDLYFSDSMLPSIKTLPLHHSQRIDGNIVTLEVIINPELENKIMSYGEHIEVLSPPSLRKTVKQHLEDALQRY